LKPFIDDVFLKSNDKEGLVKLVTLFFEFCEQFHLLLSRKKANICKTYLKMLGMVVSKKGKHLDPSRIISLLEAVRPRSKITLQALLCSYNFVRMFIPNFSSIVSPLYDATKGIVWKGKGSDKSKGIQEVDPDFHWTETMTRAYDQLRSALLEAPILVTPDWNFPLFLSVDASIRGEGWVLWQLLPTTVPGQKVAVAILYGSRKYDETEAAWETTRQEATAIRDALIDVDEYVFGQSFYLFSDHLNLRWMHNSINRAVIRMRNFLSQYRMTIVHCPGIWNNADSHSRLEHNLETTRIASDLNSITVARLQEGKPMLISIGTDTNQDNADKFNEGTVKPVCAYKDTHDTERVTALNTSTSFITGKCHMTNCSICTDMPDLSDDSESSGDEDDENEAKPFTNAKCFMTQETREAYAHEMYMNVEWTGVISQVLHSTHSTMSPTELTVAASEWNSKEMKTPCLTDTLPQQDKEDAEDYEWCGHIERSSLVYRTASLPKEKRPGCSSIVATVDTSVKKDITTAPGSPATAEQLAPRACVEICTVQTQTSPEDFRALTVKIPANEEFAAVHGGVNGHHGLDYSYRKLFVNCGSKWANERGEATKVREALKLYIEACPVCQKVKSMRDKVKTKHSFIISRPFLEVSYDIVVFTDEDKNGNRYLLVAIDNFTKLVELKAVRNKDAETVAQFLLEIAGRYGHIARLRSDRDPAFTSLIVTYLNKIRATEDVFCIPYHPQANSICERQNAIIMQHISAMCVGLSLGPETKAGWSDLIPFVFSILNNTPKNPLGISPLAMVYGVFANYERPLLPSTNLQGEQSNPVAYVETLAAFQNQLLMIAENIQSNHLNKYVRKYDKELRATNAKAGTTDAPKKIESGEFVIINKKAKGGNSKLTPKWVGPRLVLNRENNDPEHPVVEVIDLTDMTTAQVSIDDCVVFNTGWFDELTMMQDLVRLSASDKEEFVVERICGHLPAGTKRTKPLSECFFKVKWKDFDDTESSWEPWASVKDLEPFLLYAIDNPLLNLTPAEAKLARKNKKQQD
jgi:hypothetical protein